MAGVLPSLSQSLPITHLLLLQHSPLALACRLLWLLGLPVPKSNCHFQWSPCNWRNVRTFVALTVWGLRSRRGGRNSILLYSFSWPAYDRECPYILYVQCRQRSYPAIGLQLQWNILEQSEGRMGRKWSQFQFREHRAKYYPVWPFDSIIIIVILV